MPNADHEAPPLRLLELVCRRDQRRLFAPLSLTAQAGDCVEVLGPNGAGKTTLLRTLAGLHTQFEGEFSCRDFIYQGHRAGLDELLTPLENLAWHGALEGVAYSESELQAALAKVDMVRLAMNTCGTLSQGQQRRVTMARWLLSSAKLWLLDEPYTSLDKAGQTLLNEVLAQHCEAGGIVVAATHVPLTVGARKVLEVQPLKAGR